MYAQKHTQDVRTHVCNSMYVYIYVYMGRGRGGGEEEEQFLTLADNQVYSVLNSVMVSMLDY